MVCLAGAPPPALAQTADPGRGQGTGLGGLAPTLPPDDESTLFQATDGAGGPLVDEPLDWTVYTTAPRREAASARGAATLSTRLSAGRYSVRVVRPRDGARATGQFSAPAVGGALVTVGLETTSRAGFDAPRSALAGAEIDVTWSGDPIENGFVAIARFGDPDYRPRFEYDSVALMSAAGGAVLRLPAAPGDYEVRLVSDTSPPKVVARRPISAGLGDVGLIGPDEAPAGGDLLVDWFGPGHRGDIIGLAPVGLEDTARRFSYAAVADTSDGAPARLALPSAPGNYELRYVADLADPPGVLARTRIELTAARATLEAPESVSAGALVTVTHDGPAYDHAVVAIVPANAATDAGRRVYRASASARDGRALTLRAPYAPGAYEVRYILERGPRVLARAPLQVRPLPYGLEAPRATVAGAAVEVVARGPVTGDTEALVAIARPAAPDAADPSQYLASARLDGARAARLDAPAWPGDYEVRLVIVTGGAYYVASRQPLLVRETDAGVTIEAPSIVAAGAPIVVSWRGPAGAADLVAFGDPALRDTAGRAEYLAATPAADGALVAFTAPAAAGVYELRFVNEPSGRVYARRSIEVVAPD